MIRSLLFGFAALLLLLLLLLPSADAGDTSPAIRLDDLDEAFHRANADYRPVLILFHRAGCRWSGRLREEVFRDPAIRARLADLVLVEIDFEKEAGIAQSYRIRGSPTLVIAAPDGSRLGTVEGFAPADELGPRLAEILSPDDGAGDDAPGEYGPPDLRGILARSGDREARGAHQKEILERRPFPRSELVAHLEDKRLAIRLAALEILERAAGEDFGYDPWTPPAGQTGALADWRSWAEENDDPRARNITPFTESDVRAALSELFSGDRPRSRRAFARLRDGGLPVAVFLRRHLAGNPDLDRASREISRELQYAILLEAIGMDRPARRANELVHGQTARIRQTLETLGGYGEAAAEILTDFLGSGDSLVREAAVEALARAAGAKAVPAFADLLLREGDREVVIVTLGTLGGIDTPGSRDLVRGFLADGDEDVVIAALRALARLGLRDEVALIRNALADERWRVRVAAIEAAEAGRLSAVTPEILGLLSGDDAFVRTTAARALSRVGGRRALGPMAETFVSTPEARLPVANAFDSLDQPWTDGMRAAAAADDPARLVALLGSFEPRNRSEWDWLRELAAEPDPDVALAARRIIATDWFEDHNDTSAILAFFNKEDEASARLVFRHLDLHSKAALRDRVTALGPLSGHPVRPVVRHASLFDLFRGGGRDRRGDGDESTAAADLVALAEVGRHWMTQGDSAGIRREAAVFLLGLGDVAAIAPLLDAWENLSPGQRERLAESLEGLSGTDFLPVVEKLLLDGDGDVRTAMVRSMRGGAPDREWTNRYFEILNTPGAPLAPADGYRWDIHANHEEDLRRHLLAMVRDPLGDDHLAFALDWWFLVWQEGDLRLLEPFLADPRPPIRRAAWTLALRVANSPEHPDPIDFAPLLADEEPSLRALYGRFQRRDGFSFQHTLPSGPTRYDYQFIPYSHHRGQRGHRIDPATRRHLEALLDDPAPAVAGEAVVALYSHGEKIDPAEALRLIERAAETNSSFRRDLASVLINKPGLVTPDDAPLAPLLDSVSYAADRVAALREKMGVSAATAADAPPGLRPQGSLLDSSAELRRDDAAPVRGPPRAAPAPARSGDTVIDLVFFTQSGCPDCNRVRDHLERLGEAFPNLSVREYDIREVDAMRFNEILAGRHGVPERLRLTAPALFSARGFLTRDQVSFEAVAHLLEDASGHTGREWLAVAPDQETESTERIERRFGGLTPLVVLGAGLLDGLNPCAFATIIFFLSYLQVARRTPWQILQVGLAFVLGVFLTYFAVGFGFLNIVARLTVVESAARIVNWILAIIVLIIFVLSLRDGFLCLRGRLRETALQLPKPLKKLVNATIRKGVRHSRFVLAAFVTGAVIAILELACTGQVYAPTIAFVLQSGADRPAALAYLLLYNLAFVLPLLLVMLLAYRGLTSQKLQRFFEKNVALVKFGNAALFALLFGFFLVVLL
ncbi:MAG: HEAT repeat domain-containing protein [Puniceicoccaceae bacterium]